LPYRQLSSGSDVNNP